MSSKDKENKSLQDKLKQFFRFGKSGTGSLIERVDFVLTAELEKELSRETPLPQRLKGIKDLCDIVATKHLEDQTAVEKLWLCTEDLLQPEQTKECRHLLLLFLRCLIQGQYDLLTIMRGQFFRVVKEHDLPEDVQPRLELLQTLTDNGKNISCFEGEIGKFILQWMPTVTNPDLTEKFLSFLVNLIKYNAAACLSEEVIVGFVNNSCYLCCYSAESQVVFGCLQVLDAVVCYTMLPHEALQTFISALCRTVNVEKYCQQSWKIMSHVLGTDLGHSALHAMCVALGTAARGDCGLARGAVFYLNMALWGPKRVVTLKCTPTQVLPSFLVALEGNQSVVTYEVILAMQSLINKHGLELHEPAWDLIFSIIVTIIKQLETTPSPNQQTVCYLHETISAIEQLHESGQFNGSVSNMYSLIDMCGHSRPEHSVIKLITYLTSQVTPINHEWLVTLNRLVERYCRQESRISIRLKVLNTLQVIVERNRRSYEEELLDRAVLPNLQQCWLEADATVRCACSKLLIDLAMHCHSKRFSDLFDILEKLLNRPFDLNPSPDAPPLPPDADTADMLAVASGASKIFLHRLHRPPSAHAVRAYLAAGRHLDLHYARPRILENHSAIRLKLLEWFLSARANSSYHVGFPSEPGGRIIYSPYVCVEGGDSRSSHSPTPQPTHQPPIVSQSQIVYVSIRKACKTIITCLKQEKDWTVLQMVLREIPNVMQNKALVLSKNSNDIDLLASALCSMVAEKSLMLPETLRNTPGKMSISDFHASVLPVLTCLAPYHAHLDPQLQQRIIKCVIRFGLVSRCAQQCVMALTIFTLEMRDTMVKLLPEVLLDLSKISATIYIAVPILEFLSTLTRLPKVFASFVGDQYMSVFAILLPYTNPFKYNHYIVSLAHHVIAAWFLKCRLPFRRDFVKFIKHGLHNNILKPFEEGKLHQESDLNQDSSSRKRSSSLTEKGSRRRELPSRLPLNSEIYPPQEASITFHIELTETCIDLMARYTYSPCISAPKRLPTADFLLSGGQSMSWLLGHKIITVTTSGCSQNALRQGLCDRCLALCKAHAESMPSPYGSAGPVTSGTLTAGSESDRGSSEGLLQTVGADVKRYTKYTLQHSKSNETTNSSSSISDNILYPPSSHNTLSLQSLSGHSTRQNSSENKSTEAPSGSPKGHTDSEAAQPAQLSLKLENLKQFSEEKSTLPALPARLEKVLGLTSNSTSTGVGGSTTSGGASVSVGGQGTGSVPDPRSHCACWCGGWAEIHIRGPTGDTSWVMRIQNQVNFDSPSGDFPLSDISSLFAGGSGALGCGTTAFHGSGAIPSNLGSGASIASSGFADARSDVLSDGDPRSRSGSGGSQPEQLQKSSSDSIVTAGAGGVCCVVGARPPHAATHCIVPPAYTASLASAAAVANAVRSHASTGPINIPGSPQRQSSSGTNTDDEDGQSTLNLDDPSQQLLDEEGKSRHPVRRSNSSPEMSSSWKNGWRKMEAMDKADTKNGDVGIEFGTQQVTFNTQGDQGFDSMSSKGQEDNSNMLSSTGSSLQQSKKGVMKSLTKDMRVSCEAIPEEMSGSTPPHPLHHMQHHSNLHTLATHPHLMTYNSDPGAVKAIVSETAQISATSTSELNISKTTTQPETAVPRTDRISTNETVAPSPKLILNKPSDICILNSSKSTNTFEAATKGPMSQDVVKLSAKPPHSPAPASPRPVNRTSTGQVVPSGRSNSLLPSDTLTLRNAITLNLKFNESQSSHQNMPSDDLPPLSRSKRSNTISVMSPTRKKKDNPSPKSRDSASRSGASPAFVFLQLYHGMAGGGNSNGGERPLLLGDPQHARSVKNLDLVPPLETYRVGVLYVGRGQHDNETKILKNEFGSLRYAEFLQDLGTLISLEDAESMGLFLDVEKGGRDGRFAYVWQDDIMQVHFHVATLMPNNPSDPECNEKRKHIGNDFVSIVYNESGEDFLIQTIKGQFNFACIIIEPLDHGTNKVTIKTKVELREREFLNQTEPKIISDQNVALLARQLALHSNLASLISRSLSTKSTISTPYASNWLERLRIIKRLKNKLLQEREHKKDGQHGLSAAHCMDDFTEYT